ncbi:MULTISPECIES: LPP20 family lipoprotein [Gammaproteobacteria]|uniref:LPP20 family lipoprotein n=1 Tax=Gammaproteobacteria TaxID=1236 RepID=UPI001402E212|nr:MULTISPECIES: LPP20 family lipoprotein [Gammaproteobacteria]
MEITKFLKLPSILILCAALNACAILSSTPDFSHQSSAICTFQDGHTPAPSWVCGFPVASYPYSATGYSELGIEEEAKLNAMEQLASRINAQVTSTSRLEASSDDSTFTSVTEVEVQETLQGTRVVMRIVDPSTQGLYVLVTADEQAYEAALQRARKEVRSK